MTAIAKQVEDFLSTSAPFDMLNESMRHDLIRHADLLYVTTDNTEHFKTGEPRLYLIQSGQFSVEDGEGAARHLSEGDYFNYAAILDKRTYPLSVHVDSPGLVYSFAAEDVCALLELVEVNSFFTGLRNNALQNHAIADSNSMWLYKSLTDVIDKAPVAAHSHMSIADAAMLMTQEKVSSLLVTDNDKLIGIVTDRDLRSRVVAHALDTALPVKQIMTVNPTQISNSRTLFDAMALMTEKIFIICRLSTIYLSRP